ncbi:hypothetical protein M405DRAFT_867287 [Rhizopogon salebrosus TDB-379]|nr:hypothetical protein M405DRAFT_867287 [Rhizopogon salebrosus TDB-379]
MSPKISAASIGPSLDTSNIVFNIVNQLIDDLSSRSINTAARPTNKRQDKTPTFRPACLSPAPASMSSSESPTPIDDSPVTDDPGEATCHHRHPHALHGYSSHRGRK